MNATTQYTQSTQKIVLVTGASKGIGASIALAFAAEGATVIINYLHAERNARVILKNIKEHSDGMIIRCDVSDEQQVKRMMENIIKTYGRLDVVVNNAGGYIHNGEWNGTSDVWERTLKLNLISVMNVSKYAANIFKKQQSGIIINIASRHGVSGQHTAIAYSAAKAGIVNVTQAYAKLLSPFGRANAVSPSSTRAGYWLHAPKQELTEAIASSPCKRLIEPEEIAAVVLFLASDAAAMINAQNILVDGGKSFK